MALDGGGLLVPHSLDLLNITNWQRRWLTCSQYSTSSKIDQLWKRKPWKMRAGCVVCSVHEKTNEVWYHLLTVAIYQYMVLFTVLMLCGIIYWQLRVTSRTVYSSLMILLCFVPIQTESNWSYRVKCIHRPGLTDMSSISFIEDLFYQLWLHPTFRPPTVHILILEYSLSICSLK